eukprot:scaffold1166_cov261-Pinguiococcus_pyrenoidosus.AAC.63
MSSWVRNSLRSSPLLSNHLAEPGRATQHPRKGTSKVEFYSKASRRLCPRALPARRYFGISIRNRGLLPAV